jgi:Fe-S-cluster containining protein
MNPVSISSGRLSQRLSGFMKRLRELYAAMDAAYDEAAGSAGFECTGCRDNCCLTRFYHHTYIECLYLLEGVAQLPPSSLRAVRTAARRLERRGLRMESEGCEVRLMCPLNGEGRCRVYAHRPMICRLHGIPHILRPPGRSPVAGPGCEAFDRQCAGRDVKPLDRTPHYVELARLERDLRRELETRRKIRLTVAGVLLCEELEVLGGSIVAPDGSRSFHHETG